MRIVSLWVVAALGLAALSAGAPAQACVDSMVIVVHDKLLEIQPGVEVDRPLRRFAKTDLLASMALIPNDPLASTTLGQMTERHVELAQSRSAIEALASEPFRPYPSRLSAKDVGAPLISNDPAAAIRTILVSCSGTSLGDNML